MDSIPLVCITGQVPTHLIGNDAFQECDTVGITRPCTKHNYWSSASRICRACCTRRFISPPPAARSRGRGHPEGHPVRQGRYSARSPAAHGLQPARKGDDGQITAAVDLMAKRQAPAVLHRWRRHQLRPRGLQAAGPNWSEVHRLPDHPTLMGSGPALPPICSSSACSGCTARSRANMAMYRTATYDLHRRAFDDRINGQDLGLRAQLEKDPRRYRSVVDQQEHLVDVAYHRRLRRAGARC